MTDIEYSEKLFGQLDELEQRYRRFMRGALAALAILTAATCWQLFVALPRKTVEIQESRQSAIQRFCEDEKTLLTLVPPRFAPRNVPAGSPLNPHRNCGQFARNFVRP